MSELASLQDVFAEGLKSPLSSVPAFVKSTSGSAEHRFNVYRNNVFAGLVNVLETRFPAVARIVGEEFFRGFAREFVERHPPRSPALVFYGSTFADYIGNAGECADVPYLADIASIEWQLHRCYHAADAMILTADTLASSASSPGTMTFRFAPSAAVVNSRYPAFSIWQANARHEPSRHLRVQGASESTLISRKGLVCEAVLLPPGGGEFAQSLGEGDTLSEAALRAASVSSDFRLDHSLGLMLRQNAFAVPSNPTS